jgi:hypothetical protein
MVGQGTRTSGGWRGMNGLQRRIALLALCGFLTVVLLILIANAESTISDLAASGAHVPDHLVWSWEWSSMIGWLSLYPMLWVAVSRLRPPRITWMATVLVFVFGSVPASAWHVATMVAIRHAYYAVTGHGPYRFFGVIGDRLIYEYRKDVATYVQFVVIAAVVQWLFVRAGGEAEAAKSEEEEPKDRGGQTLEIVDGPVRHCVPVEEIDAVRSAGNYVEVDWASRTLLHRATLTATATELGADFVRIHRGQIVRRSAIRRVASDRSGDFIVTLASGSEVRGSRRYRDAVL